MPVDGNVALTWPVSVSNLYSLIAGLFEPTVVFIGVIDGAIIIHETGLPAIIFTHTTNKLVLLSSLRAKGFKAAIRAPLARPIFLSQKAIMDRERERVSTGRKEKIKNKNKNK